MSVIRRKPLRKILQAVTRKRELGKQFMSAEKKDSRLTRVGVTGYNKPKRTPNHPTKSHVVVAKSGDQIKTIRFGQQGVSGAGKNPKTASEKARKRSFKARHGANLSLIHI